MHNKNLAVSSTNASRRKLSCCCYNLALPKLLSSETGIQFSDLRLFPISMTKRYFTSVFPSLSIAVLMYEMGIFSIMQVILCFPQKSSISCVSLIPPTPLPPTNRRAASRFQGCPNLLLSLEICVIDTSSNWQEYGECQNTSLSFSLNELIRTKKKS